MRLQLQKNIIFGLDANGFPHLNLGFVVVCLHVQAHCQVVMQLIIVRVHSY